jgi:hypothetical protein
VAGALGADAAGAGALAAGLASTFFSSFFGASAAKAFNANTLATIAIAVFILKFPLC